MSQETTFLDETIHAPLYRSYIYIRERMMAMMILVELRIIHMSWSSRTRPTPKFAQTQTRPPSGRSIHHHATRDTVDPFCSPFPPTVGLHGWLLASTT